MDFHQLQIFLEVARQKNFTQAARNLFLSQPTVSMHIKKLEKEIGSPLLLREAEGLRLTEEGKTLFCYAQQLLDTRTEALAALKNESLTHQGPLEIAASTVPGAYLLPHLLRAFLAEYPEVTFSLILKDTKQVVQLVKDYTYDFAFAGEVNFQADLERTPLLEDELIVVAAPDWPIPLEQKREGCLPSIALDTCAGLPFLLREPGSATRKAFEEALKRHGAACPEFKAIGVLESQEAIKEAVKAGLGLTVISRKAVEDELQAGLLQGFRLNGLPVKRTFYLVTRKESILPALSKSFVRFARAYFLEEDSEKP